MRRDYRSIIAVAFFLLLTAWQCRADDALLAELNTRNQGIVSIQGRFQQTRTISVLPVPLVSTGQFYFQRGSGIRWEVWEPIHSTLQITPDGIQWADDPQADAGNAASGIIGKIFLGMIGGELDTIAEFFVIEARGDLDQWELTLSPISASLAAYIDQIIISGTALTERAQVMEKNGDRTQIIFTADSVTRQKP